MSEKDVKPRQWTLRINSNNDGSGYIYSGNDVSYPKDDYLKVIELEPTLQLMKEMCEAFEEWLDDTQNDFSEQQGWKSCKEVLEKYRKFLEGIEK